MDVMDAHLDNDAIEAGCVLTIGNFDGVHAGHCEILRTARRIARERGVRATVMTFDPHPVAILHPERAPEVLTPLHMKKRLLEDFSDALVVIGDNRTLLGLSAEDFVDQFLMRQIRPSVIVEGDDFNFGVARSGNIETLKGLGRTRGFDVEIVNPEQVVLSTGQCVRVSSTLVRYMLESGHVADAAVALKRPYQLFGRVVTGRGKGRELGFPTLNMCRPDQILPCEGVYAGFVRMAETGDYANLGSEQMPAVFSIGQARTFGDSHPLLIEAHLLERQLGDMTHKWMSMDFVERLRTQHKYVSVEALTKQIALDCDQAKQALSR
jgi:riboflavin kinase/FMN adenylyltransferase